MIREIGIGIHFHVGVTVIDTINRRRLTSRLGMRDWTSWDPPGINRPAATLTGTRTLPRHPARQGINLGDMPGFTGPTHQHST